MTGQGSGWVYTMMGAWHRWLSHVIGGRDVWRNEQECMKSVSVPYGNGNGNNRTVLAMGTE
jgi:hypothetical protein